jgi:hypothetical protein
LVRGLAARLNQVWTSPALTLVLLVWNATYLLLNVHDWTGNTPWGWVATGFWFLLSLFTAHQLGRQRANAQHRRMIVLQNQMIRLQKEALDMTLVTPVVSISVANPEREEPQRGSLRLGPICPN